MTVSKTEVGTSYVFTSWLGTIEYQLAYDLQKPLWAERLNDRREDKLLLLEHPPTLTLVKSGKLENLLVPQEELSRQGVSLFFTGRVGDITFHGPRQLVAYPVLDLRNYGKDIPLYIFRLLM